MTFKELIKTKLIQLGHPKGKSLDHLVKMLPLQNKTLPILAEGFYFSKPKYKAICDLLRTHYRCIDVVKEYDLAHSWNEFYKRFSAPRVILIHSQPLKDNVLKPMLIKQFGLKCIKDEKIRLL